MRLISVLKQSNSTFSQIHRYFCDQTPRAVRSIKSKSSRPTVQYYVDSVRVRTVGGRGGDGCVSFLHAWCKDEAGPDGGDGGHGGHVIFKATHEVKSLNHVKSIEQAKNGERGFNKDCCGKNAQHVIVPVPLGTIVKDVNNVTLCDLKSEGSLLIAARGGAGGRGNKFFLTATQQAPEIAEYGAEGESNIYYLELRSMAHVGLIGFPNAGKSTLLRAISRARPKVAPYPFTTIKPHVGMVQYEDHEQVAVADLPGLIPGSHQNYGLGIQFLKHAERCCGLIYLLDGTEDSLNQYEILNYELNQYNEEFQAKPAQIVVNKIDTEIGSKNLEKMKCFHDNVLGVSAKTGKNIDVLLKAVRIMYDGNK